MDITFIFTDQEFDPSNEEIGTMWKVKYNGKDALIIKANYDNYIRIGGERDFGNHCEWANNWRNPIKLEKGTKIEIYL